MSTYEACITMHKDVQLYVNILTNMKKSGKRLVGS